MLVDRWIMEVLEILLAIFSVYLFFLYFGIFFQRKEGKIRALIGVAAILAWQFDIWDIFWILPSAWNLCVAMVHLLISKIMDTLKNIQGVIFDYGGTIDTNSCHWAEVLLSTLAYSLILLNS